jgi:hypothetical protein
VTPRCCLRPHAGALRRAAAHTTDRLEQEPKRPRRYKLLVIDEIGYLAFDHDAANLFFQLVAARYEQGSILVTSNMPFGRCGEIFAPGLGAVAFPLELTAVLSGATARQLRLWTSVGGRKGSKQRPKLVEGEARAALVREGYDWVLEGRIKRSMCS